MASFKLAFSRFLTGRIFIVCLNFLVTFLTIRILITAVPLLPNYAANEHQLETLIEGIDNVLISFGVVLEERGFLMNLLKLYPTFSNRREKLTDHTCEAYGIGFLLLGLFMEIPSTQIALPNDIVNTVGLEHLLYFIVLILSVISLVLLVKFSYQLLRLEFGPLASHRGEELE
ncbi:MAG: hypothetical protein ACM37W_18825 [Actinomycetota bacterium]